MSSGSVEGLVYRMLLWMSSTITGGTLRPEGRVPFYMRIKYTRLARRYHSGKTT